MIDDAIIVCGVVCVCVRVSTVIEFQALFFDSKEFLCYKIWFPFSKSSFEVDDMTRL